MSYGSDYGPRYRGVSVESKSGRWKAIISYGGRRVGVGSYYKDRHEAAYAYNHAAKVLYGPVAQVNEVALQHRPNNCRLVQIKTDVEAILSKLLQ